MVVQFSSVPLCSVSGNWGTERLRTAHSPTAKRNRAGIDLSFSEFRNGGFQPLFCLPAGSSRVVYQAGTLSEWRYRPWVGLHWFWLHQNQSLYSYLLCLLFSIIFISSDKSIYLVWLLNPVIGPSIPLLLSQEDSLSLRRLGWWPGPSFACWLTASVRILLVITRGKNPIWWVNLHRTSVVLTVQPGEPKYLVVWPNTRLTAVSKVVFRWEWHQ